MTEIVSAKFKGKGKSYFFDPAGLTVKTGDKLIVSTSKGLELAECSCGNHFVGDEAVVAPLRPVVRIATEDDMRIAMLNARREKEAFEICRKKIAEHGLDMKLVEAEISFEGNKTMFFFTSDGRVDFRELVKDLAGVFHNRIELRQIGVRDEAKMLGGIGICGRPYCCNQFLEDFQPVSTKMAKVQSLSLNPTKISGSCGRLMCCLRYEEDAYEDLLRSVPKTGAFVETKDGYGTAVQVNLLRQTVKVKMDGDDDNDLRLFRAEELAAVPGGRPADGTPFPKVLNYVPKEEEAAEPSLPFETIPAENEADKGNLAEEPPQTGPEERYDRRRSRRQREDEGGEKKAAPNKKSYDKNKLRQNKGKGENTGFEKKPPKPEKAEEPPESAVQAETAEAAEGNEPRQNRKPYHKPYRKSFAKGEKQGKPEKTEETPPAETKKVPVKTHAPEQPKADAPAAPKAENGRPGDGGEKKNYNRRRGYYHKPKPKN